MERRIARWNIAPPSQPQQNSVGEQGPVEWIESHFFIPELHGPIELYPYQKAVLREAHRRQADGKFVYNIIIWSDIKKSAKSSIAAAVALYRAHQIDWGSLKIVANDLKQADSRVAYYMRRAIQLNPTMSNIKQAGYKTTLPNQTVIEAIPIDPGGEAGGNDDLIIFSELWAAKHKAIQQMWTEMTLSPTKFGYSQRWIETYAGYSGESPILENLYNRGVKEGDRLDLSYTDDGGDHHDLSDLEVYASGDMLCLWNDCPRLPWQTGAYYSSERGTLLPDEFRRVHRNQWVSSTDKFVPDDWWEDCKGKPVKRGRITLALDAAVSGDCFGLVGSSKQLAITHVRIVRKWEPPKDGKIDFEAVEKEIIRIISRNAVSVVRYDPHQLHDMATRLAKRFRNVKFVEFKQGEMRLRADKQLYDKIRESRVVHDDDPDLTEHIQNANAKKEDERLRIVKRNENLKIDLAVALSMSAYEEIGDKPKPPGILAHGGVKGWVK